MTDGFWFGVGLWLSKVLMEIAFLIGAGILFIVLYFIYDSFYVPLWQFRRSSSIAIKMKDRIIRHLDTEKPSDPEIFILMNYFPKGIDVDRYYASLYRHVLYRMIDDNIVIDTNDGYLLSPTYRKENE